MALYQIGALAPTIDESAYVANAATVLPFNADDYARRAAHCKTALERLS
ncbi:hypothetical protein AB4120_16650 [Cupriavidus sp. 2KB_3]|nr:hypothetical protein [Cupriavidus campinensis]